MKVLRSALLAAVAAAVTACSTTNGTGTVAGPISVAGPGTTAAPPAETALPSLPSQAQVDACALLTKAEADALGGVTLLPAVPGPNMCMYPTPTSGPTAQVEIYVGDGAKKSYDIDRDNLGHEFTDVPGVGDEAHLETGSIFFRKGSRWVQLRLLRLDDVDTGPALAQVAKIVAGRL